MGLHGGWNGYGYVDANPLMYSDPTGLINYEAQRQLNEWFGPKTSSGQCATALCAPGLLPVRSPSVQESHSIPTAPYLHDVMEDVEGKALAELRELFGEEVTESVDLLSDPPGATRKERKAGSICFRCQN
jgi:hypothetical protein